MKVIIINLDRDQGPLSIEVDPETQLGTLKSLIEVELSLPIIRQRLVIDGKEQRNDNATLQSLNVKDQDVIGVHDLAGFSPGNSTPATAQGVMRSHAERLIESCQASPEILQRLEAEQPSVARAVRERDIEVLSREIARTFPPQIDPRARRAVMDPLSPEAQAFMMEQIRQEAVEQNKAHAWEVLPESFGDVVMLYIKVEVNDVPIMAFVDSGAQATIMSEECTRKCNIERLMDRRYHGVAKGVGSAHVIGRVHLAQLKVGGAFFAASFTVLENQTMDLLFGLDLLRRHQCCIDLRQQRLFLGTDTSVPFLSEAEIREIHDQSVLERIVRSPCNSPPLLTEEPGSHSRTTDKSNISQSSNTTQVNTSPNPQPSPSRVQQAIASIAAGGGSDLSRSRRVHTQEQLNYGGQMIEESKVKQLTDLGFDRIRAQQVLRECRGDTEMAAARLAFG